jgi:asparagine synthase (glutamine-hydrolysing)
MIAFLIDWTRRPVSPEIAHRMSSSLGVGFPSGAKSYLRDNLFCASVSPTRNWRPTRTENDQIVLFAGTIYNAAEVCERIGRVIRDSSELYAAAYRKFGDEVERIIVGEYASIVFSENDQTVRVTRSPIKAPPIHFFEKDDKLILSSTPRAIFSSGYINPEIDDQKVADGLFLNYNEGSRSWYKGIRRICVGTRSVFSKGKTETRKYYDIASYPKIRLKNDADYVDVANDLLRQAISATMADARKPALLLSGGLDSQAIAAHALQMAPDRPLLGLTSVPEPEWDGRIAKFGFGDESSYVDALAEKYPSLKVEKLDSKGLYIDEDMQRQFFLLSNIAPRNAENLHWIFDCHARAKEHGCDLIMDGGFGNMTISFNGLGAIPGWFKSFQWGRLWRELNILRGKKPFFPTFLSQVVKPLIPPDVWNRIQQVRGKDVADPLDAWCPLSREWAEEMCVVARAQELDWDPTFKYPPSSTDDLRLFYIEKAWNEGGDIEIAFETLYGMKRRDPMAYRPLVEFCFAIPDDQYLRDGTYRWLARRMLKGMVPDVVVNEWRIGRQGADWHLRLGRRRQALKAELEALSADPKMAKRFNLGALISALDNWPSETPLQAIESERAMAQRLELAVARAVTTARFIRYVEGGNAY